MALGLCNRNERVTFLSWQGIVLLVQQCLAFKITRLRHSKNFTCKCTSFLDHPGLPRPLMRHNSETRITWRTRGSPIDVSKRIMKNEIRGSAVLLIRGEDELADDDRRLRRYLNEIPIVVFMSSV